MHDFANCSFYITTSDFSKKISTRFLLNFTGFFVTMGDIKLNENVSQCVSIFPKAIHVSYLTMLFTGILYFTLFLAKCIFGVDENVLEYIYKYVQRNKEVRADSGYAKLYDRLFLHFVQILQKLLILWISNFTPIFFKSKDIKLKEIVQ